MRIALTNSNLFAIVDSKYAFKVKELKFYLIVHKNGKIRVMCTYPHTYLPQILFGKAPKGFEWDHIDRDTLNNRKSNLRLVTRPQNMCNRSLFRNNKSGLRGVYKSTRGRGGRHWLSQMTAGGVPKHLGYFLSRWDAAYAYNQAAKRFFGKFAQLNFIPRFPRLKEEQSDEKC